MSKSLREPLVLTSPKYAALALAIDGRLVRTNQLPTGRLEFVFENVPLDLEERVLNDAVTVSAKRYIDAMEGILSIIASRRRR
jgi:hypothetical protein